MVQDLRIGPAMYLKGLAEIREKSQPFTYLFLARVATAVWNGLRGEIRAARLRHA